MTPERWAKIRQIFEDALAFSPEERDAFLTSACSGDLELRREVEGLLAQDSSEDRFLDAPLWKPPETERRPSTTTSLLFPKIGHYRIVGVLGEGGMGTVYEAEQEHPRRIVALKVIKPGWANAELLRRFELESQALGRLQHSGIAQIYEAGTADAGFGQQPYFAMEFIRGETLREYADTNHLGVRERLELMIKICDAVYHAHQRGIIHRDLKPGNILVDQSGQPKILDFGVARVMDSEGSVTRQTDLGQLVGTLAYMSPEQVLADPYGLDTRSDVYALGVILYELLAGQLPYRLSPKLHEAVQTIQEEDPAPLSAVNLSCRGDVETIVGKALEKERERRYGSAAALAEDLSRYLKDEPILARPASAGYQLKKFARRNRALVAGVAAVFVALAGGIVVSTWQAVRANRASQSALVERDRATSERNRARAAEAQAVEERNKTAAEKQRADLESATATAVNDFLQKDLLAQASASRQARPGGRPDPDLKVRTALDRAAARIEGKFPTKPLVEASIRQTMATTYEELGLYTQARQQAEQALKLRRSALGEENPDTLASKVSVASQYVHEDKPQQAESILQEVLKIQRGAQGDQHTDTLATMSLLGVVYRRVGKYAEAESLGTRALSIRRRLLGPEHPDTLDSMSNLAVLCLDLGKYGSAESLLTAVIKIQRRTLGEEHPDLLANMGTLALAYSHQAKHAQAEALLLNVVELERRILGEEHSITLASRAALALSYFNQKKYGQAEALYAKLLDMARRVFGEEHRDTVAILAGLASAYALQGKYAEAEPLHEKVVEINRRVKGGQHPDTLFDMHNLAQLYQYENKLPQADKLAAQILQERNRVLGQDQPATLESMQLLAVIYREEGKYSLAEPLLLKLIEISRRISGEENPRTVSAMSSLGILYRRQGKYSQAEPLLSQVLEVRRRSLGEEHPDTRGTLAMLGAVKLEAQKFAEAEPLLRQAMQSYEKASPEGWERYNNQNLLGASLAGQKRYAEAEPLLVSGYQELLQREPAIPGQRGLIVGQAGERIVKLYQMWDKPDQVSAWRGKIQQK